MADYKQYFQVVLRTPSGADAAEEFFTQSGRYANFRKDTYFIRYLCGGAYDAVAARAKAWEGGGQREGRVFVPSLSRQPDQGEMGKYMALYEKGTDALPFRFENWILQEAFQDHFREMLELFQKSRGRAEASILRNFAVKLLYWIDLYFPRLFVETKHLLVFPKFVCGGTVKLPEYLFLCLLYRMGCDVLYIGGEDISLRDPDLLKLSLRAEAPKQSAPPAAVPVISAASHPGRTETVRPTVQIPRRPSETPPRRETAPPPRSGEGQPLDYVELAKLARSVVMLQVFDDQRQCYKTGSGVIVHEGGYILTNFHVVSGGRYFGILLEEEQEVFYTNELIKYHPDFDLAILRMQKHRTPIPVRRGGPPLVRGQKVVAIGSPLGLFNTVSDGIISGFRTVGERSMIQFTAPTSHGSSGGALLDLYGNLIGVITAGFDDGQNLNLAVDSKTILEFSGGLL